VSIKRLPIFAVLLLLLVQGGLRAQSKFPALNGVRSPVERPYGLSLNSAAPQVSSATFDLQSYTAELERWSASADRLRDHPKEAAALRKQLPDSWLVTVEGQRFAVSTQPLRAALERLIQDPGKAGAVSQEVSSRVGSLREEARVMSRVSGRDYSGARAKLDDILKLREFRQARGANDSETLWDRYLVSAWEWINKFLNRAGGHPKVADFLRWGIVLVLGLVCLAWLFHTLTHIPYTQLPAPKPPNSAQPLRDWGRQARDAAAQGEFREAIRIIYGSAVLLLGEGGAWHVDPARTHREYLRLLPADSALRPHLAALTDCFEQVWYGRAQASAREYEAALAELESLE
jgi:hypothetical protein